MNEYFLERLWLALRLAAFFAGVALVIIGQRTIGFSGLATMLLGLAVMLGVLYDYNRRHK